MNENDPSAGGGVAVVIGYAVGVGICFMATLGLFLQYSQPSLNAGTAALVAFGVGAVLGAGWAVVRRIRID